MIVQEQLAYALLLISALVLGHGFREGGAFG